MKKTILALALTLSSTAFARMCEVDMVDNRTNRLITTIRAYDYNDGCKEGMKACRLEIRQRGLLGRADCVRATDSNPYPVPNPHPTPNPYPHPRPNPNPYPHPRSDAQRMINNGERVIFNNTFVTVVGVNFNGLYAVRSNDVFSTITSNIRREQLSVLNGCISDVCTSEQVIDVRSARLVNVVGLSYDDRFVTQTPDVFNTLTSSVDRRNLAVTRGCISSRYAQVCVGNQVIDRTNRYATVAGIQMDGRVVLQSTDVFNTITTNVDPSSLVVTR